VNIANRVAKLEKQAAPTRGKRFLVRFEGPGSEGFPQPTEEEVENCMKVFTVHFLEEQMGGGSDH
jgi:hypothetical protein